MSVIFETLQKLNRSTAAPDTGEAAARPRRNTYALKSVLLSPVTVLLLALLVFGLGYGLVFGLRHLQRQARLDPAAVAAAKAPASGAAAPGTANPETAEVPPPPDIRHLEGETNAMETGPAVAAAATAAPTAMAEAPFSGPDVPPPSEEQMASLANEAPTFSPAGAWSSPPQSADKTFSVTAGRDVAWAGGDDAPGEFSPAGGGSSAPVAASYAATGGLSQPLGQDPAGPHAEARSEPAATAMPAADAAANGEPYADGNTAATRDVHWGPTAAAIPPAMTARRPGPPTVAASAGGAKKAKRPVKRAPIPRYTELVNRLQTAVTNGDAQAAEKLLGDFAAVKGKDHPYLLKLMAYQHLQAREFAAAERLLNQVLALDQTDRDANLNLVVVEAHTGRIDAARRRVARLAELYPEDETLAAMGRRLN
jgi:hypothetical protein